MMEKETEKYKNQPFPLFINHHTLGQPEHLSRAFEVVTDTPHNNPKGIKKKRLNYSAFTLIKSVKHFLIFEVSIIRMFRIRSFCA